jgi:hypothetical protein
VSLFVIITAQAPDHVASKSLSLQSIASIPHTLAVLPSPESRVLGLGVEEGGSLGHGVVVVGVVEGNVLERLYGIVVSGSLMPRNDDIVRNSVEVVLGLESDSARSSTVDDSRCRVVGGSRTSFLHSLVHLHGHKLAAAGVLDSIALLRVLDVEPFGVAEDNDICMSATLSLAVRISNRPSDSQSKSDVHVRFLKTISGGVPSGNRLQRLSQRRVVTSLQGQSVPEVVTRYVQKLSATND